jgi:hypothetical protein
MKKPKKTAKPKPPKAMSGTFPLWPPHLDAYRELASLTFPTHEEIDKGIELLWTDELRTLPHDLTDGYTIIVPKEAVEYFTRAGLKFKERRVRRGAEVPAEEMAKLRKEQGIF